MRVLAFSDVAPPEGSGGVERTLTEIYGRLAERGQIDVQLVALGDRKLPKREQLSGYHVHRAARLPLERLTGAQLAISASVWRLGIQLARKFRPHVIHAHTLFFYTSMVAAAVARLTGTPLLLTVHVGSMAALPQPYRTAVALHERTVGRLLLSSARRIVCVSDDVQSHVLSLGAAPEKVSVVPNGVDLDRFGQMPRRDAGPPTVISVGRLIFNKGVHDLIDAAGMLRADGLEFRLLIVGDGPLRTQLEQQALQRGLGDVVTFAGHREDVECLLRDADIFARPSLSEGMSLAVLEAMAAGLPVVATEVSGSRELIADGESGFVVGAGRADELATVLRRLVLDRQLRTTFGANARERAQGYTWEHVADATANEMARVAAA